MHIKTALSSVKYPKYENELLESVKEETSPIKPKIHQSEETQRNVSVDLQQHQKLIDRLYVEIDRKAEAIQKIGQDCVQLRSERDLLEKEMIRLQAKLEESDLKTKRLIHAFDIDIIPIDELRRRYALLAGKLESAVNQIATNEQKLEEYEKISNKV